jgi:hypothetical protein
MEKIQEMRRAVNFSLDGMSSNVSTNNGNYINRTSTDVNHQSSVLRVIQWKQKQNNLTQTRFLPIQTKP